MNKKNKKLIVMVCEDKYGMTAIYLAVLVLVSTLTITMTASDMVRTNIIINRERHNSVKAYFAAESGAERILWELRIRWPRYDIKSACDDGDADPNTNYDTLCFVDFVNQDDMAVDPIPGSCQLGSCMGAEQDYTLLSGAYYNLNYSYIENGGNSTSTIKSTGIFEQGSNVVGRRLQLVY